MTSELEEFNDQLRKKLNLISAPSIIKSNIYSSVIEFRKELEACIMHCIKHKMKQQTIRESHNESNANGTSVCVPLDVINATPNAMLSSLIEAINGLKTLELLDLSTFEDKCVSKISNNPKN